MSHYAEESYDVYHELRPIARKEHKCSACRETIAPGTHYTRCSWVFDGEAQSVKRCERCQTIHEHLRGMGQNDEMWPAERLDCGEEYKEHWGKEPPPEIAALAFWRPGDPLPESPELVRRRMRYADRARRQVMLGHRKDGGYPLDPCEVCGLEEATTAEHAYYEAMCALFVSIGFWPVPG